MSQTVSASSSPSSGYRDFTNLEKLHPSQLGRQLQDILDGAVQRRETKTLLEVADFLKTYQVNGYSDFVFQVGKAGEFARLFARAYVQCHGQGMAALANEVVASYNITAEGEQILTLVAQADHLLVIWNDLNDKAKQELTRRTSILDLAKHDSMLAGTIAAKSIQSDSARPAHLPLQFQLGLLEEGHTDWLDPWLYLCHKLNLRHPTQVEDVSWRQMVAQTLVERRKQALIRDSDTPLIIKDLPHLGSVAAGHLFASQYREQTPLPTTPLTADFQQGVLEGLNGRKSPMTSHIHPRLRLRFAAQEGPSYTECLQGTSMEKLMQALIKRKRGDRDTLVEACSDLDPDLTWKITIQMSGGTHLAPNEDEVVNAWEALVARQVTDIDQLTCTAKLLKGSAWQDPLSYLTDAQQGTYLAHLYLVGTDVNVAIRDRLSGDFQKAASTVWLGESATAVAKAHADFGQFLTQEQIDDKKTPMSILVTHNYLPRVSRAGRVASIANQVSNNSLNCTAEQLMELLIAANRLGCSEEGKLATQAAQQAHTLSPQLLDTYFSQAGSGAAATKLYQAVQRAIKYDSEGHFCHLVPVKVAAPPPPPSPWATFFAVPTKENLLAALASDNALPKKKVAHAGPQCAQALKTESWSVDEMRMLTPLIKKPQIATELKPGLQKKFDQLLLSDERDDLIAFGELLTTWHVTLDKSKVLQFKTREELHRLNRLSQSIGETAMPPWLLKIVLESVEFSSNLRVAAGDESVKESFELFAIAIFESAARSPLKKCTPAMRAGLSQFGNFLWSSDDEVLAKKCYFAPENAQRLTVAAVQCGSWAIDAKDICRIASNALTSLQLKWLPIEEFTPAFRAAIAKVEQVVTASQQYEVFATIFHLASLRETYREALEHPGENKSLKKLHLQLYTTLLLDTAHRWDDPSSPHTTRLRTLLHRQAEIAWLNRTSQGEQTLIKIIDSLLDKPLHRRKRIEFCIMAIDRFESNSAKHKVISRLLQWPDQQDYLLRLIASLPDEDQPPLIAKIKETLRMDTVNGFVDALPLGENSFDATTMFSLLERAYEVAPEGGMVRARLVGSLMHFGPLANLPPSTKLDEQDRALRTQVLRAMAPILNNAPLAEPEEEVNRGRLIAAILEIYRGTLADAHQRPFAEDDRAFICSLGDAKWVLEELENTLIPHLRQMVLTVAAWGLATESQGKFASALVTYRKIASLPERSSAYGDGREYFFTQNQLIHSYLNSDPTIQTAEARFLTDEISRPLHTSLATDQYILFFEVFNALRQRDSLVQYAILVTVWEQIEQGNRFTQSQKGAILELWLEGLLSSTTGRSTQAETQRHLLASKLIERFLPTLLVHRQQYWNAQLESVREPNDSNS